MHNRAIYKELWDELSRDKPMIMLAGPRQSGKTTFAREIVATDFFDTVYFNWDLAKDKQRQCFVTAPCYFG
jgi:predicted AAA+ superfamily ATPase